MAGGRLPARAAPPPPPPRSLVSVARDGASAAVAAPDGGLSVYDLGAPAGAPARRVLPAPPAAIALCPGKRGRGGVVAFADGHGRVFGGVSAGGGRGKGKGGDGAQVCVLAEGKSVVVAAGGAVAAAAGGAKRELVLFGGAGEPRVFGLGDEFVGGVSAIAVAPGDAAVAVCGQGVLLVDAGTGAVLRRYQGHATPVTCCAFLPSPPAGGGGAAMFVTACAGDQFLSVWEVPKDADAAAGSGRKKRRLDRPPSNVVHTFVAPEKGARTIVVDCAGGDAAGTVSIAAALPSGSIAVWSAWAPKAAAATTAASFTVRCAEEDAVLFAAFAKPGVLTVAHGHPMSPAFFTVDLLHVTGDCVRVPAANVTGLLAADTGRETGGVTGKERIAGSERTVAVGVKDAAAAGAPNGEKSAEKKRSDGRALLANGHGAGLDGGNADVGATLRGGKVVEDGEGGGEDEAGGAGGGGGEPTLREKLASMGVAGAAPTSGPAPAGAGQNMRSVDSIGNVLAQAIRTRDDKLFDTVIGSTSKLATIRDTVSRMPFALATGDCLNMLVTRLVERPSRATALLPWVKQILMEHAGALTSHARSPALSRLLSTITARVEALPALTRLEGRLELIVAQADRVRAARQASSTRTLPAVEFVERAKVVPAGEESGQESGDEEEAGEAGGADSDSSGYDSGDANETGDFSESSDESDSSEGEGGEDEEGEDDAAPMPNGKVKGVDDLMDMSASESD